jgi:hypothetical protein
LTDEWSRLRDGKIVAAGKPPKLAITVVMRKLIILTNGLLKAGRTRATMYVCRQVIAEWLFVALVIAMNRSLDPLQGRELGVMVRSIPRIVMSSIPGKSLE